MSSSLVSTKRSHSFLWLVAAAVTVLGGYLSVIGFARAEWLSRAGCLIVVLGIWSGLGGIIQERVLLGRLELRRRRAAARTRKCLRQAGADREQIDRELDAVNAETDTQIQDLARDLKLTVGIVEVSLLITGTLLWGFGDLVARSLFGIGSIPFR